MNDKFYNKLKQITGTCLINEVFLDRLGKKHTNQNKNNKIQMIDN